MKVHKRAKITTKIVINGEMYTLNDLPFKAGIPKQFFSKEDPVNELTKWLDINAQDIWWISFGEKLVYFRSEDDALYLKLVFG